MSRVVGMNGRQLRTSRIQITTTTVLDLTAVEARRRRFAVHDLASLKPGSHVKLIVGDLWPDFDAIAMLAEVAVERGLHVHLEGTNDHLDAWATELEQHAAARAAEVS